MKVRYILATVAVLTSSAWAFSDALRAKKSDGGDRLEHPDGQDKQQMQTMVVEEGIL
jgi:hypothetical protein